ncbi:MAG: response regulator [SAR324 cluster bacterium]|nr:response regulator [SAR324 cluster bacterium]
MKILVIDDQEDILDFMKGFLVSKGHHVTAVNTALEGVARSQLEPVDLVITDIFLPVLSGMEVIRFLRKNNIATHIIAISGGEGSGDGREESANIALHFGQFHGADAVLKKPFGLDELEKTILTVCRERPRFQGRQYAHA